MPSHITAGWCRLAASAVLTLVVCAAQPAATAPDPQTTAMEQFLARPMPPRQYRALRHLEAAGSGQRGWLDAQTEFVPASGMRYHVVAEGGSGYIRAHVLRSLLDQEQQLIARGATDSVAIDATNYRFDPQGTSEDGLIRIGIRPLRKERALIAGTMFLAPDDGDLVRVEGRLARNPSFWTRKVDVVRSYARINGVLVVSSLDSTAQLRLLGRSSLRMTYQYSEVDHQPASGS
jgi:hypothetical protein